MGTNYELNVVLDEGATMPTRAHETDAGYDLYSREDKTIYYGEGVLFDTGVHIQLPPDCWGSVTGKSGLAVLHDIECFNGVIDAGYTGSIVVKLRNLGRSPYQLWSGDKIAQLIIQRYEAPVLVQVDKLEETERGDNGFGSTGR